jgi:hypothetical protein
MTKVTNLDVVAILASIGPMEVYHFAVFQTPLERIRKLEGRDGPSFSDIRENPNRGDIMPKPSIFLDKKLPGLFRHQTPQHQYRGSGCGPRRAW